MLTHAIIHTVIVTDRRSPVRVKKIRAAARYNRGADACHVTRLMCDSIHNTHNTPRTSLNTHITSCKCIDTNTCSMYPTHTYTSPHRTTSPSHGIPLPYWFLPHHGHFLFWSVPSCLLRFCFCLIRVLSPRWRVLSQSLFLLDLSFLLLSLCIFVFDLSHSLVSSRSLSF